MSVRQHDNANIKRGFTFEDEQIRRERLEGEE